MNFETDNQIKTGEKNTFFKVFATAFFVTFLLCFFARSLGFAS